MRFKSGRRLLDSAVHRIEDRHLVLWGKVLGWTVSWAYQYAFSTQSPSSFGCRQVSFRVWHACGDLTDSEPGSSPLSAHLLYPQNRKLRAADCGRRFRFSSGATIGGVDTTSRDNSKSLANLLCAYALPDDARARTVTPRVQIPGPRPNLSFSAHAPIRTESRPR